MLVKDAYLHSLRFEESTLAHYIHQLLSEEKVSLDDDISELNFELADHQKVREMIKKNVLGFHKIGIYSLKMNQTDFVFIFAANRNAAIQFYCKTFRKPPLNSHPLSQDFQLVRGNEFISFRDMRKEFESIPAIAGYFIRSNMSGD